VNSCEKVAKMIWPLGYYVLIHLPLRTVMWWNVWTWTVSQPFELLFRLW